MTKKLANKFLFAIILTTAMLVGGAGILYSVFAPDIYINQQKIDILSAHREISRISEMGNRRFFKIIKKYEDDDFRFVVADEDYIKTYSTYKNKEARAFLRGFKELPQKYGEEPRVEVMNNPLTGKVHQIELTAKLNIEGEEYYLYICEKLSSVEKSFSYTNNFLLFLVIIALISNAVVVFILCRRIAAPAEALSRVTERFRDGDFSARYEGKFSNDEIGSLAHSFNSMADKISESITNLNNYNFLLREDFKMISEYEEMRKKVVRNITHDLKTPLAIISSQIEMMQIAKTAEKRKQYYDSAMEEIGKMSNEISNILTASREQEATKISESFDLGAEIEVLANEFASVPSYKGITFKREIGRNFTVNANKRHIRQVFNNYLLNAMSHVKKGGKIKVSLSREEGAYLLSVYNDGFPIPESDMEIIWNNFERGAQRENDNSERHGIGLYIVKEIATMNSDECGVKNTDSGVEFWYRFKNNSKYKRGE